MRIAIIGAGISGLGAAWALAQRHEITIFERNAYPGGHARTIDVALADRTIPVDTGFIVYNERNYPNLTRLFAHLGVTNQASSMSFAVSAGDLEYAGHARGLFAQKRNLANLRFLRMLRDFLRFGRTAQAGLADGWAGEETLGQFIARHRYSAGFIEDHLLPMAAAIWSAPMEEILGFPIASFARFYENHGLLQLTNRPAWRTVTGGSRRYVERLTTEFAGRVELSNEAISVRRVAEGVEIRDRTGAVRHFDHAILACHADQALSLIEDADLLEARVLGQFRYRANQAYLHSDPSLMPRRRAAWASWNHLGSGRNGLSGGAAITYWMNHLQRLDTPTPMLVTLNPPAIPRADLIHDTHLFEHPLFDQKALDAQALSSQIQGRHRLWFAGAYLGYGFHEDGLRSGLTVARALGGVVPWEIEPSPGPSIAMPLPIPVPAE